MIRDTSLSAYEEAKTRMNHNRQAVYDFILDKGEVCDKDISEGLGWPINCITNRRGELLEMGRLRDLGKRKDPRTGRSVHFWAVNFEKPKQLDLLAA